MTIGILAVGNRFAGDDAIGPLVLDGVRDKLPADVVVRELDGEPARVLEAFDGLDAVVLIDAARSGSPVGTVHRVVAVEASDPRSPRASDGTVIGITLPRGSRSTHGAGVAEALGLGRRLGRLPEEVVVLGIEGRRFSPGAGLSHEVAHALPTVVQAVLDEVDRIEDLSI